MNGVVDHDCLIMLLCAVNFSVNFTRRIQVMRRSDVRYTDFQRKYKPHIEKLKLSKI